MSGSWVDWSWQGSRSRTLQSVSTSPIAEAFVASVESLCGKSIIRCARTWTERWHTECGKAAR
eukprot:5189379-Prymnesium_polylepis.1